MTEKDKEILKLKRDVSRLIRLLDLKDDALAMLFESIQAKEWTRDEQMLIEAGFSIDELNATGMADIEKIKAIYENKKPNSGGE